MNRSAPRTPAKSRARTLLAVFVSFVLLVAGVAAAPPALAVGVVVTATVSSASESGVIVQVQASGLPDVASVYAALIVKGTEIGLNAGGGYAASALPFPVVSDSASTFTLTAAADDLDRTQTYEVLIWCQHPNPDASTIYARGDVAIASEQWDAVFGPTSTTDQGAGTTTELGTDQEVGSGIEPETSPGADGGTSPTTEPGMVDPGAGPGTDGETSSASLRAFLSDGTTPADGLVLTAGDTIVVKGSGYDPAANVGGRGMPIPATLSQGTYVVFGAFAPVWQPSAGASGAARSVGAQAWALAESVLDQVPPRYQGAIRAQWVDIASDGTFTATLTLKDAPVAPVGGSYGVYTYAAGGVVNTEQERSVALDYATVPEVTVTSSLTASEPGITACVDGSGFGAATGVHAALIETRTEAQVTVDGGFVAMRFVRGISGGSFSVDLVALADRLDRTKSYEVIVWRQHTMPTADTIYARAAVAVTSGQWDAILGGTTTPEQPEPKPQPPVDPGTPVNPPAVVSDGSLLWGISSRFSAYVTGRIARGTIAVSEGATRAGGRFQFGQAAGSTYNPRTGVGTVSYRGSVRFTGHYGALDVTVSHPQVWISSAGSATLSLETGGARMDFATLDLSRAALIVADGAVTYSAAPATLTDAGRDRVLAGFTTVLDPVTFTVGADSTAPTGSTGTIAAAAATTRMTLPTVPPSATGIAIDEESLAALQAGRPATISAAGFQPNERGIRVVVYSTPMQLATVTADAGGTATWSGALPATLADGDHTLTFQGSVARGLSFTLARAVEAIGVCTAEGATLRWGYKESFRTYIEGIAKGGWTLDGVTYEYPDFLWESGAGSYDGETRAGLVTYGGSIAFSGHDGALNTTLAAARIELAGDTGYLMFDVIGTTQVGEGVDRRGVRFAEFSLADASVAEGALTLGAVPTTLTEAGAAAFGTYAAGEVLDPVSAVIPVGGDCVSAAPAPEQRTESDGVAVAAVAVDDTPLWPWLVGGLAAITLAAGVVFVVRRRGAAEPETTKVTEV